MTKRLYADRYAPDLEPWFSRHLSAMTDEELHSKSDIACELAFRDMEIERLLQLVKELEARIELLEHDALSGDYETLYAQAVNELAKLRKAQSEPDP